MTDAEKYARAVASGEVVAGKYIRLAAKRFLSDLERTDITFDEKLGQRATNFIERKLRHWEGKWRGTPLLLEPWQKFIIMQVFGWQKDGKRRIKSIYVQVARKNGKTAFAAAMLLYHLIADNENSPQILVGANNHDQAKICANSAGRILQQSPVFADLISSQVIKFSIYGSNIVSLYHSGKDGALKAMSKNAGALDGYSASLGVIDEYHEADSDSLLNVIESGQGARPEPLLFVITTAGFVKTGPCYTRLRKTSIDILEEKIFDDHHLAIIYEPDEGDRWDDESTWIKSNPNLGVSIFPDYLRSRLQKAKNEGSTKEVDFKTKNLNMWVDSPQVWIPDETWMQNSYGLSKEDLIGKTCYGGLDLASGIDINALALYFPKVKMVNDRWINAVLWWFWIPKGKIKTESFDYSAWVEQGYITPTAGLYDNIIDHKKLIYDITQLPLQYNIQAIAFDQRLAYHGVVQELGLIFGTTDSEEWLQGMFPFTQSFPNVSLCAKEFERQVTNFEYEHFDNPVARWMNGNVVIKKDPSGMIMPDKAKSQFKIDGIAALLNAKAIDIRVEAGGKLETNAMAI